MNVAWFLFGATAGLLIGCAVGVTYVRVTTARPPHARDSAETTPLYADPYCNREFYDEDAARDHAIERHNAPRDGDAWRQTYNEPGER